MHKAVIIFSTIVLIFSGCGRQKQYSVETSGHDSSRTQAEEFSCKLTDSEVQERRVTVLANLRKAIRETKELDNGYAFRFSGSEENIDQIVEFVKTERRCCSFFTFNIRIDGDTGFVWLELLGPEPAKELIRTELEL